MTKSENLITNSQTDYTIDDHGNIVEFSYPASSGGTIVQVTFKQELDQNGWVVKQEQMVDGSPHHTYQNSLEKNDNGQVVKVVATSDENASSETIYEYHDNGMLKKRTTTQPSGKSETEEFDEAGYRIEQLYTDANGNTVGAHYEWLFDSNGVLVERHASPIGGIDLASQAIPQVAKATLDDDGNITEYQDENGNVIQRITWVKVENPTDYVNVLNRLKR